MRLAALLGALLLSAGCASAPRPGPTLDGIAMTVRSRDKASVRRQAVESLLPLFLTPAARREKAAVIDKAVFADPKRMKSFIGYLKVSKRGGALVEVLVDRLSAVLQSAGLASPPGYVSGPQVTLIALGNRAVGPDPSERFAADSLETALFGRGVQVQEADDELLKLEHPITAKTEQGTVAQAAAGGWTWLLTGGVVGAAHREPQSDSWRGHARYSLSLYGVGGSTTPERLEADGEALDVSSFSAVTHAVEAAAPEAALRADAAMGRKRVGRATIAVIVSDYKDPSFLTRVIADLRGTAGVEGAALFSWRGLDEMAVIHAYATTLTADALAAKLINGDRSLRITGIEDEDARITVAGPDVPASEDRGQDY